MHFYHTIVKDVLFPELYYLFASFGFCTGRFNRNDIQNYFMTIKTERFYPFFYDFYFTQVYGANASQSATIPCFDAVLGMEYEKGNEVNIRSMFEWESV